MTDTARLTFQIDSSAAKAASTDLDRLVEAGKRTDGMFGRVVRAAREFAAGFREGARDAIREYRRDLDATERSGKGAARGMRDVTREAREQNKEMGDLGASVRRYVSLIASAFGVREAIRAADSWGQINSRLKIATQSAEEYAYVQRELSRIADLTYTRYNGIADAFANSTRNLSQLGLVTRDQIKLQEALLSASIVSGANDEKRARIMDAFNKALAMGVLRGEEWNAVQVNGSRIVGLLAEHLGKTELQIAQMARNGGISVDVLIKALIAGADKVSKEVESMPVSFEDAGVRLANAFQRYIGEVDTAYGVSAKLTGAMDWMAKNFGNVVQAATILSVLAIPKLIVSLNALAVAAARNPLGAILTAAVAATAALAFFQDEIRLLEDSQSSLGDLVRVVWSDIKSVISDAAAWISGRWDGTTESADRAAGETESAWLSAVLGIAKAIDTMGGGLNGAARAIRAAYSNLFSWMESGFSKLSNKLTERFEQFTNTIIRGLNAVGTRLGFDPIAEVSFERRPVSETSYDPASAARAAWDEAMRQSPMEDYIRSLIRRADEQWQLRRDMGALGSGGAPGGESDVVIPPSGKDAAKIRKAVLDAELAVIQRALNALTNAYSNAEAILEAQRAAGLLDEREYYEAKRAFINLNTNAQVVALEAEKARLAAEKVSGAEAIKNREQIAELEAKIAILRADAAARAEVLGTQQVSANRAVIRSLQEARQAAQDYLDELESVRMREVASMGRGERFREREERRNRVDDDYQKQRDRLNASRELMQLEGKWTEEARSQYDARLAIINESHAEAREIEERAWREREARESSLSLGAMEAMNNYLDGARNVYAQVTEIVTSAFKGMEDVIVQFATTGKSSFKSLVDAILADIIRLQVRQFVSNSGLFQSILGMLGGSSGVPSGAGSFSGLKIPKHRDGLDYVPYDNYLALLHRGERVMTAQESRNRISGVTINQVLNIGSGVSRAEVYSAAVMAKEQAKREILESIRNGGEFS